MRRERTGWHRFDADLGNFRAALDWLVATGEVEWGLRLVIALGLYFFSLRLLPEGLDRLSRLLALPGVERFPRLRNFGKFWEADFNFEIAPSDCARYYLSWNLFEDTNDRQGMLYVAHRLGFNETDLSERERWSERAVELARETGHLAVLAGALSNLADIVKDSNCTYARALHKEAMHLFESSGDEENAIWSLSHQADLYRDEGNRAQARDLYSDALTRFRKRGFSHGVASCLFDLGGLEFFDGRLLEARRFYRESLRLYGPENPTDLPRGIESLAEVAIHCAQLERALVLAGASAAIRERFHVRTKDPARRAEVAAKIDAARKDAGPAAAVWWLKGWNMSPGEAIEYAERDGDETWTAS
jgi:tetratricopeptide (TPR) repeat protein